MHTDYRVSIHLPNSDEIYREDLQTYLQDALSNESVNISRPRTPPSDDDLGFGWQEVIIAIIGSGAFSLLLEKILDWSIQRKQEAELEIEYDGIRIKVRSEDIESALKQVDAIIERIEKLKSADNLTGETLELRQLIDLKQE